MFMHNHCIHKQVDLLNTYITLLKLCVSACVLACLWSAVAQRYNAGLAIKRARVRIPFDTVEKFGHFLSLHDASVDSAV